MENWKIKINPATGLERDDWWYLHCKERHTPMPQLWLDLGEAYEANQRARYLESEKVIRQVSHLGRTKLYSDKFDTISDLIEHGGSVRDLGVLLGLSKVKSREYMEFYIEEKAFNARKARGELWT